MRRVHTQEPAMRGSLGAKKGYVPSNHRFGDKYFTKTTYPAEPQVANFWFKACGGVVDSRIIALVRSAAAFAALGLRALVSCAFTLYALASCASAGEAAFGDGASAEDAAQRARLLPPPGIVSSLNQTVDYNGKAQAFIVRFAEADGDGAAPDSAALPNAASSGAALANARVPYEIYYYPSETKRWFEEGGTSRAPVKAGFYYVRIKRPEDGGYAAGEDLMASYRIQKGKVTIITEEKQSAPYNGDPKRVAAGAVPDLPLSFSYYPSADVRDAALDAMSLKDEASISAASAVLSGLKRVERAPVERGVYYVIVYYPGDENYEMSYRKVEFTIGPPVRRF